MSPLTTIIYDGSSGIWPDMNIRSFAFIACEYGPMAAGAFSVFMGSNLFISIPAFIDKISMRFFLKFLYFQSLAPNIFLIVFLALELFTRVTLDTALISLTFFSTSAR